MASWDYYHDPSRQYDYSINERTRHDSRWAETERKTQNHTRSDEMSGRLQPDYHTYDSRPDSRYSYPPPPPRDRSRNTSRRSPSRQRRQWPPPPKAEEEKAALAREFRPDTITRDDEALSKGTIDQEPIILEVPEFINDRRFVLLPTKGKDKDTITPPSSDDERKRRGRPKAPKLETGILPEMRKRQPSPYAWTKPTPSSSARSSGEFFLSPDSITPPVASAFPGIPRSVPTSAPTSVPKNAPTSAPPTSAPRDSPISAAPSDPYASPHGSVRPSYVSARREANSNRKPSPRATAGASNAEDDYSIRDPGDQASTSRPSKAYTDPSQRPVYPDLPERYKPSPLKPASVHHSRRPSEGRSSHESHESHEPSSRRTSSRYPPSPPRSPNSNFERSREVPPTNIPLSRPTSRGNSAQSSPLPSPHIKQTSLNSDVLWGSIAASTAFHQPKQASRLSSSVSTLPDSPQRPRSAAPPSPAIALPYPDEDGQFQSMPSERDHQYFPPELQRGNLQASFEGSRPTSRGGSPATPLQVIEKRPTLSPSTSERRTYSASPHARPVVPINKAKTTSQLKALSRSLPPCPRQGYSGRYDDWYKLEGCPGFDMCPDCVDSVFGDTIFRSQFRRAPTRAFIGKGLQVKCDFADAWVRLGWLMTLQRELPSLDLIKALVNSSPPSDSDEACPGSSEAVRNWYSVRDRNHFLRGFAVCAADVRKLQILFPGFRELWQPLPMRASYSYGDNFGGLARICSLRPALNSRFPQYLDCLIGCHEPAYQAGRMPDASEFLSLVGRKTMLHECTRDDMLRDQPWHYIPSLLPALTVCEDCFEDVVQPAIDADTDVAMRFNREAQNVYSEGRLGSSCQLYSARMRDIFQRAVKDNDLRYLARRAMDRKETEDKLQERVTEIRRLARRLKGASGGYGLSPEAQAEMGRLNDELNDLTDEWAKWE